MIPSSNLDDAKTIAREEGNHESATATPPVISSKEEYHSRLDHFNPGAKKIPHDVMRFDPTELERQVMELLHAIDTWATQKPKTCTLRDTPIVVREKDDESQAYLATQSVHPDPHASVRERMNHLDGELETTSNLARENMDSTGPSYRRRREYLDN